MARFGLIGQSLKHSFSQQYFTDYFEREKLPHSYSNYEMENVDGLSELIHQEQFSGLNVTIPFKEDVIPLLDEINSAAKEIGAVNVIKADDGKLIGYNTDYIGFRESLALRLRSANAKDTERSRSVKKPLKALVLGSGGASKAIKYSLDQLDIKHQTVSRSGSLNYASLNIELISQNRLIINCTPLGTFPNVDAKPDIPYQGIGVNHILYDLVYNPAETAFLKEGKARGAFIQNGAEMLRIQAKESWKIWNN